MRRIRFSLLLGLCLPFPAFALTLSGNVPEDFDPDDPQTLVTREDEPDIGMPDNFPEDAISGLDIAGMWLHYDAEADTLTIGFETFGIGGDVDGDGDPGGTSAELAANGGRDNPDFGETEGFALYIDTNGDEDPDVVAGKPAQSNTDINDYQVATFNNAFVYSPTLAFDEILPEHTGFVYASPSEAEPHLEFTIVNVSTLPGMPEGFDPLHDALVISVGANMSSLEDDGIGEDYIPGSGSTLPFEFPPPTGSIAGLLFSDLNGDGIFDGDESPFPGVEVSYAGDNGQNDSQSTDDQGEFFFTGLIAQTYTLTVTAPFGYALSDPSPMDIALAAGEEIVLDPIGLYPTDSDGDGILDLIEGEDDKDLDGTPNYLDLDSDGDGLSDTLEAGDDFADPVDSDGDGLDDYLDTDSDNDGIPDEIEQNVDTDSDDVPNYLDLDSDGDGIPDEVEGADDIDGDGAGHFIDLDSDGDGFPDAFEAGDTPEAPLDSDGDGRPDFLDRDADDDGLLDGLEGGRDTDGDGLFESADDSDGDGQADYLDPDSDNDGLNDGLETGTNASTADPHTDTGSPNFVPDEDPSHTTDPDDMDTDDDCIPDGEEDADHNGALDAGETAPDSNDTDGDGIQDGTELGYTSGTEDTAEGACIADADAGATTTDPNDADSDDGGVPDGIEDANQNGQIDDFETDPNDAADDLDADGDGLSNDLETQIGTDPFDPDTDDDGIYDGADGITDADGDGAINALDLDADGDGHPDAEEAVDPETGVIDPTAPYDHDGDGTPDHVDMDSDDDGLLDEDESTEDHDGDGATGIHDPDSDNDGLYDGTEGGITEPSEDTDIDSGVFVPDTDPATTTDPNDADSDDDGLLDGNEDADGNGAWDEGETDPANPDTDGDCIQDGTELGLTEPERPADSTLDTSDTDPDVFIPDEDPATTTDPTLADSDAGGADDGQEDGNCNGVQEEGESDPNDPDDDVLLQDSDGDGLSDEEELDIGTNPYDADTDDDGIPDGDEALNDDDDDGLIEPLDIDSDNDGLQDGTEMGLSEEDVGSDTDLDVFIADADPETTTDPLDADSDDDGLTDGEEDANGNGALEEGETDPADPDSDDDGIQDGTESGVTGDAIGPDTDPDIFIPDDDPGTTTDPLDDDSDDDGLLDGSEDLNHNGLRDSGEIDPMNPDTDGDCIQDGTEMGLSEPEGQDTDLSLFVADADPSTTTDPLIADTDGGGLDDGGDAGEDRNCNGLQESGESDPNDPGDDVEAAPEEDDSPTPDSEEEDYVVLGGGGCSEMGCSTAGDARPGAQGALLLMMSAFLLTWVRRKGRSGTTRNKNSASGNRVGNKKSNNPIHSSPSKSSKALLQGGGFFVVLSVLLSFVVPGLLRAQDDIGAIEVQHFHPVEDLSGAIRTEGAKSLRPGALALGLWLNFADDPLVVWRSGEPSEKLQDSVFGLDFVAAYGLSKRLQLNINFPLTPFQNVSTESDLGEDAVSLALNDPSLGLKIVLVAPEGAGFGLALAPRVWVPLGRAGSYTGGAGTAALSLIADRRFGSGFWLGGNLGYRYRPVAQSIGPLVVDDELFYRLGAAVPVKDMHLTFDLFGRAGLTRVGDGSVADAPLEFMVGLARPLKGATLTLGASTGLVAGYGAPDFRLLAGITLGTARTSDRDRDGITDALDQCPDTPEDFDKVEDLDGCPEDNDRDGIPDKEDECPSAPEDFDHFEDLDGCPDPDNDQDYVPDASDDCPNDPEDRDRFEDDDGCPDDDNDRDGLPDVSDKCPDDPEDKDGFEDGDGCPDPDNDQDTIPDEKDECPMVPETMNGDRDEDGCPEQLEQVKVEEDRLILLEKIHFDFDKDTIRKESYPILDNAIEVFKTHPNMRVRIEGHTDARGSAEYNLALSTRRAEAVKRYVIEKGGLDPTRFEALGKGESQPVASNENEEGRAKNRRIEWIILTR